MPSTVIDHFHYTPDTATLRITFVSGTVYDYKGVPEKVYQKMRAAPSKGKFFNEKIKGIFPFEQMNG
jgi:hypothetical protein